MRLAGVWLALLLATGAAADTRTCRVVAIADGDSLTCMLGGARTEVRLDEIDAPEREQPYGSESKQSLTSLCMNRQVTLDRHGVDDYGRVLARVTCNGVDANEAQVRKGMAWVYDHYVKDRSLYNDQTLARSQSRGLWADADPTPPWNWRHSNERRPPSPKDPSDNPGCRIKGNISARGERIYHVPGQNYYAQTQIDESRGERWFCSAEQAIAAGWRAAKN